MLEIFSDWRPYVLFSTILYLVVVRVLRYRRGNAVQRKFSTRASYRDMNLEDAFAIQSQLAELEFPTIFSISVFFALFKTYGIPSISHLLVTTGQFTNKNTASKRAADTGVILTEVLLNRPFSTRAMDGIARMNYLHGAYRKSGKISDDDMLYTLSLFALEPARWASRYEWRDLNEAERCAMGTYWRFMGDAMEIPYTALKSYKTGWTDGLQFLDELEAWSIAYEAKHMIPAETNRAVAKCTTDMALFIFPTKFQSTGLNFVSGLLDPQLRKAIKFDDPSWLAVISLSTLMLVRKILIRHCALPRPYLLRKRWFSDKANSSGRFHAEHYICCPWYVKPTFFSRWEPKALLLWLSGGAVPRDSGDKYLPNGYIISELGPDGLRGKGEVDMQLTREKLVRDRKTGCPFSEW